ncbi:hypothetical protein KKF59_03235 [Patescibacteria group bacterium]|nr:hypothetical protein [Patescibacteria group bacterium]MBU1034229.1 hypothetical protein [Patescibacteria group bacterium]MBU1630102.1 hypothetical protein [Patescibacteria group bacterium]MBU1908120.1 hypothetical protein [Patescibacteria group bacterium]
MPRKKVDRKEERYRVLCQRLRKEQKIKDTDLIFLGKAFFSRADQARMPPGGYNDPNEVRPIVELRGLIFAFLYVAASHKNKKVRALSRGLADAVPGGMDVIEASRSATYERVWAKICRLAGVSPIVQQYIEDVQYHNLLIQLNDCDLQETALEAIFNEVAEKSEHILELVHGIFIGTVGEWREFSKLYCVMISLMNAYRPLPKRILGIPIPHEIREAVEREALVHACRKLPRKWGWVFKDQPWDG